MSAGITAIAAALAAPLGNAPFNIRNLPYLPDQITPPIALVGINDSEYHAAAWTSTSTPSIYQFTVFVVVSRVDDRATWQTLEGYMSTTGATSIIAALETDRTLGGVVSDLIVRKGGPTRGLTVGGVVYATTEFTVEVHAE